MQKGNTLSTRVIVCILFFFSWAHDNICRERETHKLTRRKMRMRDESNRKTIQDKAKCIDGNVIYDNNNLCDSQGCQVLYLKCLSFLSLGTSPLQHYSTTDIYQSRSVVVSVWQSLLYFTYIVLNAFLFVNTFWIRSRWFFAHNSSFLVEIYSSL